MRTAQLLAAAALVTFTSLPMLAQQAGASVQQDASAQAVVSASATASGNAAIAAYMLPVNGELVNKLDTKSAKVGDQIAVKTTEYFKSANGVEVPKGLRLLGSVTEVQAHGSDSADSHISIRFDRAELKGGKSVAIQSEIRALSPPVSAVAESDGTLGSVGVGGRTMGNGRGSMAGADPAGGSLGGVGGAQGTAGGALGGAANTTGRTAGSIDSAPSDAAQASGRLAGTATDAGGQLNAGVAGSGAVHATGIPGIMLAGRVSDPSSASGTLSASKKNVHLDSGTQKVIAIAADSH
jgi:hypothetical protein